MAKGRTKGRRSGGGRKNKAVSSRQSRTTGKMAKEGGRVVVPEIGAAVQGAGVQMPAHMILPVQASGEAMQGRYTNMAVINHTGREFVVDFFFTREGLNMLVSRVITSPAHAKALHRVLGNNIEGYEKKYGEIKE